jgi:serine/threonine protein phosphatase PrpC
MAFDPLIEERKVELLKKVNFPGQKETVSGTTATVLLITPDEFICANAGDSRTVLSKNK